MKWNFLFGIIAGIEQIAAQLRDIVAAVDDTQIMAKILVSLLPSSLQYLLAAWDSTPQELKTLSSLTKRLVKEELSQARTKNNKPENDNQGAFVSQQSGSDEKLNNSGGPCPPQHAYPARGYSGQRGSQRGRGQVRSRGGRSGYYYPYGNRNPGQQTSTQPKDNNQPTQVTCYYCGQVGHFKRQCVDWKRDMGNRRNWNHADNQHQSYSYKSSADFMERRPVDWFADSGATQHMTDQRDLLINFVPVGPEQWNVSGIGGTSLPVIGQGDVIISSIVDGKLLEGILTGKFFFVVLHAYSILFLCRTDEGSSFGSRIRCEFILNWDSYRYWD